MIGTYNKETQSSNITRAIQFMRSSGLMGYTEGHGRAKFRNIVEKCNDVQELYDNTCRDPDIKAEIGDLIAELPYKHKASMLLLIETYGEAKTKTAFALACANIRSDALAIACY